MTDTNVEERLRETFRAKVDTLVVEDRAFDPGHVAALAPAEQSSPPRRPRTLIAVAAVLVVFVVAALVVRQTTASDNGVRVSGESPTTTSAPSTPPSAADLAAQVAAVPVDVLNTVGKGSARPLPQRIDGPVATKDGKPRILWIGAEYCPFCAAQRWALVLALSRFGTFADLGLVHSATKTPTGVPEVFPATQSFTFHGSRYSSPYVTFDAVETEDDTYAPLDAPTPEQQALVDKYDAPPYVDSQSTGAIPFLDFGDAYVMAGATYDTAVLQGKRAADIANALSDPGSEIAQGVVGSANVITDAICRITNNQPARVCAGTSGSTASAERLESRMHA